MQIRVSFELPYLIVRRLLKENLAARYPTLAEMPERPEDVVPLGKLPHAMQQLFVLGMLLGEEEDAMLARIDRFGNDLLKILELAFESDCPAHALEEYVVKQSKALKNLKRVEAYLPKNRMQQFTIAYACAAEFLRRFGRAYSDIQLYSDWTFSEKQPEAPGASQPEAQAESPEASPPKEPEAETKTGSEKEAGC